LSRDDTVALTELDRYGLTLAEVRRWPVVEYGPPSSPYWLRRDLVAAGLIPDVDEDE
jgi:hypothetical protein